MYKSSGFLDASADADDRSNSAQICSLKAFSCPLIIKCDCFADAQHDGISIGGYMAFVSSFTDNNSTGSHRRLREVQEWKVFVNRSKSAEVSFGILVMLTVVELVSPSHASCPDSARSCLFWLEFGVIKYECAEMVSNYLTDLPEYSSPLTLGRI